MSTTRMRLEAVLLALLVTLCSSSSSGNYKGYRVIKVNTRDREESQTLQYRLQQQNEEGLITLLSTRPALINSSSSSSSRDFDILCAPQQCQSFIQLLNNSQLHFTNIIDDLQKAIEEENPQDDEDWENRGGHRLTWRRYHQYKDILSYMDYLAATYPDLCQVKLIGKSSEGREIKLLTISSGGANKPAIWIDAGLHAREWISPATATYMIMELVELKENHKQLLEKYEWHILPVANPDGYEYSRNKDRLWRKSRAKHGSCIGVDLNRNFGYQWQKTRGGCNTEDYSGPSPFSEPETQVIRDFITANKHNIKAYLSLHSYSQMWLIPWGYTQEKPKDYYEMYLPAEQAIQAISNATGTQYLLGTPHELIYTSTGSSDDWAKGEGGIDYSYTVELPDTGDYGFLLPASRIIPVGKETWIGIKAFAQSLPL